MAILDLNEHGYLPDGVHDCSLEEIEKRFGQFQHSDRRCRLFARLKDFLRDARASGLIKAVIVDGSFVTDKDEPNDIDVIVVLGANHDFSAELRPREYNVIARPQIRRLFRLDALAGREGKEDLSEHIEFFGRVRNTENLRKGMLRVTL